MKCKLDDICFYVKDKVPVFELSSLNYISTENMLPDKAGITEATTLPSADKVQAYSKGDILVSNIRPYFKKIWLASSNGGCSNDVLVFRAKAGISSVFLYYILSNNEFFEYATATAKGTKMPRGDKKAIMEYMVPDYESEIQKKIGNILKPFDDKISLNQKINENLEQQAQALFKCTFPFTVSDSLPTGWSVGNIGDIVEIHDSKRIPLSGAVRMKMEQKKYPYYGAAALMDYVDDYIFDGKYLLLGEDGTVVDNAGYPILQYVWGKFWVNNHAHILTGKRGFNVESLLLLLKRTSVRSVVTGAVQPKISQANLKSIPIVIPPESILKKFNEETESLFSLIRSNNEENKRLSELRDTLLPKLMSGEMDVSSVQR